MDDSAPATYPNTPFEGATIRGSGLLSALTRRWPTLLAIVVSAATLGSAESDDSVRGLSEVLLLLPLLYLILAVVQRRGATWPVLVALLAGMVGLRQQDWIPPSTALVIVALAVLLWGADRGQLRGPGMLRVQTVGMVGFGALGLLGLAVNPDLGRYIVAAGWFGHGVWDFVHLRADKVVARSFAEWCAVIDTLIAVQLVFKL